MSDLWDFPWIYKRLSCDLLVQKEQPCFMVADLQSLGWEVVPMMMFTFADLIAFGMLIIALLTFVFAYRK